MTKMYYDVKQLYPFIVLLIDITPDMIKAIAAFGT
jgi:hypothetical protein